MNAPKKVQLTVLLPADDLNFIEAMRREWRLENRLQALRRIIEEYRLIANPG
jgi:hypothetical protein